MFSEKLNTCYPKIRFDTTNSTDIVVDMPTDDTLIGDLSVPVALRTSREMLVVDKNAGYAQWNSPIVSSWADNIEFKLDMMTS